MQWEGRGGIEGQKRRDLREGAGWNDGGGGGGGDEKRMSEEASGPANECARGWMMLLGYRVVPSVLPPRQTLG